jgi:hypothetical protein
MLHVWNIYHHLPHKWPSYVGKYTIHGAYGIQYPICFSVPFRAPRDFGHTSRTAASNRTREEAIDYVTWTRGRIIGSASLSMAALGLKFVEVLERFRQKI